MECRNETLLIQVPPHGPPHRSLSQGGGHWTSACSESREQSYLITSSWCTHTHTPMHTRTCARAHTHTHTYTHTHAHTHTHTHTTHTLLLVGKDNAAMEGLDHEERLTQSATPLPQDLVRLHRDDGAQGKDEGMDVLHVEVVGSHCV